MVDVMINKYLETQLALAKQRLETKNTNVDSISEKSLKAANKIAKKQERICKNLKEEDKSINKVLSKQPCQSDLTDDEEYLPPCKEDEYDHIIEMPSTSQKQKISNKIIDDGEKKFYNERIESWKKNLKAAKEGDYNVTYSSADIQYVLEGNKDTEENHQLQNGLCVPNYIWKQLYKYQRTGVKWLWELHQVESGGLLGDEMGLGKTVQVIAFLAGLSMTDSGSWGGLGPCIILSPATVIYQWVSHFHYWFPQIRVAVLHHSGSHAGSHHKLIRDMHSSHGILLVTYAGIVKYIKDLLSRKWHYIILDEGHKIRNPDTQVSKMVKRFETSHKLLITGSPMQNSLQELWSLFDFMRPGLLGSHTAFMEHFAVPITQGGYANASEFQEATALEIAKALKNLITPYMLRRTKTEVQDHIQLPEKNEQVLFCSLTQEQKDLYMGYLMSSTIRSILDKDSKHGEPMRARILVALSTLRKICNHPDIYLYEAYEETDDINEKSFGNWKRSGKMSVVHSLLKIWLKQGHRALIFTQSRAMLCILEQHLQNHSFKYLRMDGSVNVGVRQNLIKTYNENPEYLVFLATTRVGGLGVNLTGADRVIIYDPDWNPATDNQAKERAWRIGQERNVTVYRLLSAGTIEEKIYQRQIFKNFLSNKILIDPNQKNVLTTSNLQSLFSLENLNCDGDTETTALFKHTKVNINGKKNDKSDLSKGMSYSKKKIEAMKRRAREISKQIKKYAEVGSSAPKDPRQAYKEKRDLMLNPPPKEDEPEINIVNNEITNVPFEHALSESDIVYQHTKKDYENNLIKEALSSAIEIQGKSDEKETVEENAVAENPPLDSISIENDLQTKKESKKRHSSPNRKIDNLVAIKKAKIEKSKKDVKLGDDDYVLSKLFAKSAVKNALHHDGVVGLAEKEKRHRIKEDAIKAAKKAVRAIKFSS
ncbi:DNA excision repair protein ERCC-6-like [Danaus plexippus]|uniref:DNA excision repair protein ERCC-6-like n=1 Tax=Danaus plexippus TaxID=13037 RepID=UPI002AB13078|nr:DNA excision repair protein ERCC-6-like [Danaus plexippus]